ncbi:DUF3189 family protein [Mahella australiensis]|jgi:hypothetical protein|uniref:DUF3189 family protein n=1 Tax=Mahella australiensis (strain DSM 15567 / CIP 107919 / 50-1 BON) TaxID=697281 RepID=F4A204_MAHA5|nr:DUF3189 family protein [Mahella australiensis]AEE97143.1 hypothetical protein Mahau_1967 [Mahella australiensis 50-1 BON]
MKIIYHSYSPSYAAAVAAAMHIGILPGEYVPDNKQILSIPYFGRKYASCFGLFIYVGIDEGYNEVYILGTKNNISVVRNELVSVDYILHMDEGVYYADVSGLDINISLPEQLYYMLLKKRYSAFIKAVSYVKNQISV